MNRQSKGINALVQVCVAVLVACWYGLTPAQVPDRLNYQGYLTDSGGTPISGAKSIVFTLYNAGGATQYTETQTVSVNAGVFNVAIGSVVPMNLPFDVPYFLGIKVGTDPEMTPRQAVLSSPYAQRADISNTLAPTGTVATSQLVGTIGSVLIADNAVTQAKLSASAAVAGQVLGTNGSNLQWQNAAGGGTVTSVGTGSGLSGGPITSSGTINLAATQLLPAVACAATQIPKWSGAAWTCAADDNGGASGGLVGQVLTGTGGVPAWSGSPFISGNLTLVSPTTATTGIIFKGANRFVHGFGLNNAFFGEATGNLSMSGSNNTGAGFEALFANTSGSYNTASGVQSLYKNTTGHDNVAMGIGALYTNDSGYESAALGPYALFFNTTGYFNTATGSKALYGNTTGYDLAATGYQALYSNTTGKYNTAIGANALFSNTSADNNTAVGSVALGGTTTGTGNTAIGTQALTINAIGSYNTAGGFQALANNIASNNAAFGAFSLEANTSGISNTAVGTSALSMNTSGVNNTANGSVSLLNNVTGSYNTASGAFALASNNDDRNTAMGEEALYRSVSGFSNSATGFQAMHENVSGYRNTAMGDQTLYKNYDGVENTAIGLLALFSNTSGSTNTALGSQALIQISTGNGNTAIGWAAGHNVTTGFNNIYINNPGGSTDSGVIRIGDFQQTYTSIAGISGVNVAGSAVYVNSSGQLGVVLSSRRFKDEIADMNDTSASLMKLRPVTFHYKSDQDSPTRPLHYGLIAEEVAEVYPDLVTHGRDGQIQSVRYQFLAPMLLNEYQKQQRTIGAQAAEVTRLTNMAAGQATRIGELERDRQVQVARIEALEGQQVEIAALALQVEQMARLQTQALGLAQVAHASQTASPAAFK